MLRHLKMPAALVIGLLMGAATAPQMRAAEPASPVEPALLSLPAEGTGGASACRVRRTRYFRVNGRRVRARYVRTGYRRIRGRLYKVRYYRRY